MGISVDKFEKRIEEIPFTEAGTILIKGGKYNDKQLQYRKYASGNLILGYVSFTIFPENEIFIFETSMLEVQQETKKLFKECGFVHSKNIEGKTDEYIKGNIKLLMSQSFNYSALREVTIYTFRLEK